MIHDILTAVSIIGVIIAVSSHLFLIAVGFMVCIVLTVADVRFSTPVSPSSGASDRGGGGR